MMDVFECIKERRSIRDFEDTAIPHALLEEIIEAAAFAPSWKNSQIARYIVVENRDSIDLLAEQCVMGFAPNSATMKRAPALVLVTMVSGRSGFERDGSFSTSKGDRWEMFDAGIATQTFCLAAHAKGVGTVIMGIFDEKKVEELFGLPEGQQLAAIVALGYPKGVVAAPRRKSAEELISYR
ncbi:MAG TPA: nitroreductase family protein [Clostridia bacterium]|nr:nitroreductase family protein [Clostridia bacterium]